MHRYDFYLMPMGFIALGNYSILYSYYINYDNNYRKRYEIQIHTCIDLSGFFISVHFLCYGISLNSKTFNFESFKNERFPKNVI